MVNEENLFSKGMLISLKTGTYGARKKLTKEQLKDLPQEIVRGVFDMFDKKFKDYIRAVEKIGSKARGGVKAVSVPFPISGVYFLPTTKIEGVINFLEEVKTEREKAIKEVMEELDEGIKRFKNRYPDYYAIARDSYPTKDRLQQRFYMEYQFVKIAPPDKKNSILTADMYRKEMEKFRSSIQEMKDEVISTIYGELTTMTKRLQEQCTDGKPNQRTINNVNKFLKKIDEVYSEFIDREDVKNLVGKIKRQMNGVSADNLRDSESAKKQFKKEIASLAKEIKALPDVPLTRLIEI